LSFYLIKDDEHDPSIGGHVV